MQYEHFSIKIPGYNVETWYIGNIVTLPGQCGSAQKFATLAGGYYPPLHGLCHRITAQKYWLPTNYAPPLHGVSFKTSFVQRNFCAGKIFDNKNIICYHWYIHPMVIASKKFAMGYPIASGDIPMQSPGCLPDGYGSGRGRRTYIQ